ncbi:MAG: glycosyltransferase family 4 protein, partial [Planctomycetota bacterium]
QQPAAPTSAPASAATQNIAAAPADRPRVALVVDTDNWAFGNIARQLQRHLADRFDFRVVPMDVIDNVIQVLLMTRDCDVVHFFWREHLLLIRAPYYQGYVQSLGAPYQRFFAEIVAPKALSTAIYDHLMLDERARAERRALYTDLLTAYYVGSERLRRVYTTLEGYPRPAAVLPDGVDLGLFHPRNLARFATTGQRELVVGWVGNSKWAAELEDFKGVQTILKPALDELRAEGLPVRAQFADRAESPAIPHDRMVHYYEKIDVYVCTSKIEGTPNPVLESMACGVPVISTDVGIVPQAFGPRQREFLLPARSVACVKAALRRLVAEPGLFRALSEENLQSIQAWDWRLRTQPFADYFHECLRRRAARLRA